MFLLGRVLLGRQKVSNYRFLNIFFPNYGFLKLKVFGRHFHQKEPANMCPPVYDTYDSSDDTSDTSDDLPDLISDTDSSFSDASLPSMVEHFQDCDGVSLYPSAMFLISPVNAPM